MIKIAVNYAAAIIAFLLTFYAFNLGMDQVNFKTGVTPVLMFPVALACLYMGICCYMKADDLCHDKIALPQ